MSGYAIAMSPCLSCRRVFSYNPLAVPSIRINGVKEPLCENCFDRLNEIRKQKGLEPWVREPDAYEPIDERAL